MDQDRVKPLFSWCFGVVTLVFSLIYITQLGKYGLLEPDEGRYAEIGREMVEPGADYLVPLLNGVPHFQKPPLYYWFIGSSLQLFGNNEFAVRIPGALAAVGVLLLTMGIAHRLFGVMAGRLSLVVLASCPLFMALARVATPDMMMSLWITGAIYGLVRARESRNWQWLLFGCAGIGFLTKGPVSFLVPFSAAILFTGFNYKFNYKWGMKTLRLSWVRGMLLSLVIGLSWFLVMIFRYHDLSSYFWNDEFLDRFGSVNHGRSKPIWFFIPVLIGGILPWTWAAGFHVFGFLRKRPAEVGLFIGWVIVPFLVLSFSGSKLVTYMLPIFPGVAVAIGGALAWAIKESRFVRVLPRFVIVAMSLYILGAAVIPLILSHYVLESSGIAWMWLWLLFSVILAMIWVVDSWGRFGERQVIFFAVLSAIVFTPYPSYIAGWNDLLGVQASVRPLAARILEESDESIPPRVISCDIRASGLPFYLGRTVGITRQTADLPTTKTRFGNYPVIYESFEEIPRLEPEAGQHLFVVMRKSADQKLFLEEHWELLQSSGGFSLWKR